MCRAESAKWVCRCVLTGECVCQRRLEGMLQQFPASLYRFLKINSSCCRASLSSFCPLFVFLCSFLSFHPLSHPFKKPTVQQLNWHLCFRKGSSWKLVPYFKKKKKRKALMGKLACSFACSIVVTHSGTRFFSFRMGVN